MLPEEDQQMQELAQLPLEERVARLSELVDRLEEQLEATANLEPEPTDP